MSSSIHPWWKEATFYQIWPASYKDGNGDGMGDIPGILSTLDHLKELGVDCVWLSPMYDSPQKDFGYDISNYEEVWPPFGTVQDMDKLIAELKKRGMKLILDLVINHTSDQHAWFKESRKSRDNKYSDWYIWRDPVIDAEGNMNPPNNWGSFFGGSAWEYVPERGQYYLHLFLKEQVDLNWESAEMRKALYEASMGFWMKRGISGFRVDTALIYAKNPTFQDAKVTKPDQKYQLPMSLGKEPKILEYWKEIGAYLDAYDDVFLVGEASVPETEQLLQLISPSQKRLSVMLSFEIILLGGMWELRPHQTYKHTLVQMKTAMLKEQKVLDHQDLWKVTYAENHDQARSISRFATDDPSFRVQAAKLLALIWGTLSGSLFLYQGQEIGMRNFPLDSAMQYIKDPWALNYFQEVEEQYPGDEEMRAKAIGGIQKMGRDHARTPVPWNAGPHGGFSIVEPWMPLVPDYKEFNVAAEESDPKSVLSFWKRVLKLRKSETELFVHGKFVIHDFENPKTISFTKEGYNHQNHPIEEERKIFVVANFSDEEQPFQFPPSKNSPQLLLSSIDHELGDKLSPWEARAYLIGKNQ